MGRRLKLHDLLTEIADEVYFQPPSDMQMKFPCVVYKRSPRETQHANDKAYLHHERYEVTVIDRSPNSEIFEAVANLPRTRHSAFFVANKLNHDVFDTFI